MIENARIIAMMFRYGESRNGIPHIFDFLEKGIATRTDFLIIYLSIVVIR